MKRHSEVSRAAGALSVTKAAMDSEFVSESDLAKGDVPPAKSRKRRYIVAGGICLGVLLVTTAVMGMATGFTRPEATLTLESDPASVDVLLDGAPRGRTPLTLALAPGTYTVTMGRSVFARERRITLAAAERASIYHLQAQAEVTHTALENAALSVVTNPAGGRVSVDGVDHGGAPIVVRNLASGAHKLTVRNQGAVFEQTVTLEAGSTATVVVGANPGFAGGWLTTDMPLRLEIHENGRLVGSTDTERLMLPAGDHELTFSDGETGFRGTRSVRITPGETTRISLPVARVPVNVNAIPWADVWMNNQRIGETPIGNYQLPLGKHELELRHPQLGIKRVTMMVTLTGPNRISVNMRQR